MVIEVVAEFGAFLFFAADDGGDQVGVFPQIVADLRQQRGVFGKPLHQNIARAVQGRFAVGDAVVSVNIFCGFRFRIVGRFVPQQVSQRLQPGFDGDLPAGTALRLVRQVEVFQFGFAERGGDGFFQRVGQFALFSDGFEDRLTTVFQLTQIPEAGFQITQLRIIQSAGDSLR